MIEQVVKTEKAIISDGFFVVLSGVEPELFCSRGRHVASYTTGQ